MCRTAVQIVPDNLVGECACASRQASNTSRSSPGGSLTLKDEVGLVIPQGDLPGKVDLVLNYLAVLPLAKPPAEKMTALGLPLIWPRSATKQQAKVGVWAPPHLWPTLDESKAWSGDWSPRAEKVPDHNNLPGLVVEGAGATLPLLVRQSDPDPGVLAGWLCDRGLIQVFIEEDGAHHYRARFLLRKVSATHIDVKFPVMVQPLVTLNKYKVMGSILDNQRTVIRIPLDSVTRRPTATPSCSNWTTACPHPL